MTDGYRGSAIASKRGFLASLWSIVTILSAISFLTAFIYALSTSDLDDQYYNYNNQEGGSQDENREDLEVAVTSRALAFSASWAGVLTTLLSVFGTVILGWQSPTGLYYTCCSTSVHRTTPLGIGSFIGALLMFANLTLVCSVLFGEFQVSGLLLCKLFSKKNSAPELLNSFILFLSFVLLDSRQLRRGRPRCRKRRIRPARDQVHGLFDTLHHFDDIVRGVCGSHACLRKRCHRRMRQRRSHRRGRCHYDDIHEESQNESF